MKLDSTAEQILAYWLLGCVSPERVVAWADGIIAAVSEGAGVPNWLLDLSLKGPKEFLAAPEWDSPRPKDLSYTEKFRAMVECCRADDMASVLRFAKWCAYAAMGEDLALREVVIGYKIDHAFSYQNSGNPIEIARNAVKEFQPHCHDIADSLGERPADLVSCQGRIDLLM